nr:hypothetical protein [Tanacetum cinerariifolium]
MVGDKGGIEELEEKYNLKTLPKRKMLPERQPELFLICVIEFVFPDINTAFGIRRIHVHDTAYLENLTPIDTFYKFLNTAYPDF